MNNDTACFESHLSFEPSETAKQTNMMNYISKKNKDYVYGILVYKILGIWKGYSRVKYCYDIHSESLTRLRQTSKISMTLQWCYITAMTSNVTGTWNVCSAACFRLTAKKLLRITGSCRGFPSQGGSVENGSISWSPHWIAIRSRNPVCGNGHQNIHFFPRNWNAWTWVTNIRSTWKIQYF